MAEERWVWTSRRPARLQLWFLKPHLGSDGSLHASRRLSYNLGSTGVYAKISVEFCRSSCGNSARRMWRWGNDSGALVGGDDRAGGTANPAQLNCSVRVNLILEPRQKGCAFWFVGGLAVVSLGKLKKLRVGSKAKSGPKLRLRSRACSPTRSEVLIYVLCTQYAEANNFALKRLANLPSIVNLYCRLRAIVMGKLETKVPATWAPERALTPGSKGSTGERLKK
ncbi:hypothetical protein CPSG_08443 [Coccidioides posadasii str. Silveira]|uniref:Uncharacterized protein n=1 Tax=Coccidioides posadasii (strain RMSCC 757 / Silveira) TaxID=443226 RepID=E9DFC8_COCPS|nr:hypothetical protein CPSG_08443 [Coccidioides posadasii str. Silveira]